jgi:hypothetical protein
VNDEPWTYAKTMPEWPHEYLVRDRVDGERFEALVRHIRSHGYEGHFYSKSITYYEEQGLVYWTMGALIAETTIINRCKKEDSFEQRSRTGTLPVGRSDSDRSHEPSLEKKVSTTIGVAPSPFRDDVRRFVESTPWTFAKTYAATWPHEYVVRTAENAPMILALARHIFEEGTDGRFYSRIGKYHHEGGKVYWSMDATPEDTELVNRCDETQTYEARLAAGTLPKSNFQDNNR